MRLLGIMAALGLVLSGCAGQEAFTQEQVKEKVSVQSGYPGCEACYKVKTFSSPVVASLSSRVSENGQTGWLNAKVQLVTTNYTPQNLPKYRLRLEMVNNGVFGSGVEVLLKDAGGGQKSLPQVPPAQENRQCFSNMGSGCSWTQTVELPTAAVQNALATKQGLDLFVGVKVISKTQSSDGYRPTTRESHQLIGKNFNLSSQVLLGFTEGVQLAGGQLPSAQTEGVRAQMLSEDAEAHNRARVEQLVRERPLKQKLGAQLCRSEGGWVGVGFVEQITQDKLQIRIADMYWATNPRLHQAGFRESIIWDSPDAWALCGNG